MRSGLTACLGLLLAVHVCVVRPTTLQDRQNCGPGDTPPATRVDTTERLRIFRQNLNTIRTASGSVIAAFIVGSGDAHNSEYPTSFDRRRGFISGFGGSAGTAVITQNSAALWTDGRYFTEGEEVLDCNWILMKSGLPDTPSIAEWINSQMTSSGQVVAVDWTLVTHTYFTTMKELLAKMSNAPDLQYVTSNNNPTDRTWTTGRPEQANSPINALDIQFAGIPWSEKISDLRTKMTEEDVKAFAVTGLDEIAWLFNIRGTDVDYNPFVLGYAIVEQNTVSLYIRNKNSKLQAAPTDNSTSETLQRHLGTSALGSCAGISTPCVQVREYVQSDVENALRTIANTGRVWVTFEANYAIYSSVQNNVLVDKSPIALSKSMKNSVERMGMQKAYNRDSVVLIKFLAFLEKEIEAGREWTEVSAAEELDKRRSQAEYARGLSFETISSYGPNGAVIHYRPSETTNRAITTDGLYLLDSGGQYLDGTTDVTRTMHYGTPTDFEKECYTRVLMSSVSLAMLRWPEGLYGRQIDALARYQLWEAGLVYRHGTGHGIGAYLSVHEGPGRIRLKTTLNPSDEPLSPYNYFSDEPGYYEENKFGIRLETIVMVSPHTPKYDTAGVGFYEFKPITLVPFEPKLTDLSMLNTKQLQWLNKYNTMIKDDILPLLAGDQVAINWVNKRIQPIDLPTICGAEALTFYPLLAFVSTLLSLSFMHFT
ncbi:xaa-Pro aminopeptidase 1 [Aplysia californica]|uniref:Xaa-Pro aminopeptidase 1 n=1 Tax=Aplysia californica TaxID=6500 RepID=A0ABM0JNB5_APLCA|nr:xaa-Pro aminopeptidase 1 [Aplysia californica]